MENYLTYTQLGDKNSENTLVFLHGSTMTKEGMLPLAEKFEEYNCISLDLTAHGESEGELPESISDIAGDVAITCEIALRKNTKVDGIVFLSSAADLKHYTPAVDQLKNIAVENFKTEDILDFLFGNLVGEAEKERIKNAFLETGVRDEIGYNDLMISNAYDCLDKTGSIDCPTLLIHGCEDSIILPVAAVETWKQIENSQLLMVPYGGHALIYEDTAVVAEKIKGFVQKVF